MFTLGVIMLLVAATAAIALYTKSADTSTISTAVGIASFAFSVLGTLVNFFSHPVTFVVGTVRNATDGAGA